MLAMKENATSMYQDQSARVRERNQEQGAQRAVQTHSRWNRLSMVGCIVVAFASIWMLAAEGANIDKLNYANVDLQTKIAQASAENASLTAQIDQMEQPSVILNKALNQLHMQYANPITISGVSSK